jgi:hypothetical protein
MSDEEAIGGPGGYIQCFRSRNWKISRRIYFFDSRLPLLDGRDELSVDDLVKE